MLLDKSRQDALERQIAALNCSFTPQQLEKFRDQQMIPLLVNGLFESLKIWLEGLRSLNSELTLINGLLAMIYYEVKLWQTSQAYATLAINTLPHKEFWQALLSAAILQEVTETEHVC